MQKIYRNKVFLQEALLKKNKYYRKIWENYNYFYGRIIMTNRMTFLLMTVFFLCVAGLFGREEVLIDFSNLRDTTVDFSTLYTTGWGADDPEARKQMATDLDPKKWSVCVNSSSKLPVAINKTYALSVDKSLTYPGKVVLGVRTFFPERGANSYVEISPPFDIPSYYDDPNNRDGMGTYFINKGIVRNVGVMRKISVRVLGNNFNYGLYLRIKNRNEEYKDIYMGCLNFLGWRDLVWVNPNYEQDKKDRELKKSVLPYYPDEYPYIKFVGFVINRDHTERTGNFTTMFKEVSIEFDEHFLKLDNYEYLQEDIFNIYREELLLRASKEMEKVNRRIYTKWLEEKRMDGGK